MKRFENQNIIIRDILKIGKIVKILPNEKYLISYYDSKNIFKYKLIDECDIVEEDEYNIIKKRVNGINRLFNF